MPPENTTFAMVAYIAVTQTLSLFSSLADKFFKWKSSSNQEELKQLRDLHAKNELRIQQLEKQNDEKDSIILQLKTEVAEMRGLIASLSPSQEERNNLINEYVGKRRAKS